MNPNTNLKERALSYHQNPSGKIEVVSSKPCNTAEDLTLAYTPGVAAPCLEIHNNPESVYDYTTKGNLVAVISDGTAVLGLGNIGPLASKPVMEGKGILFKKFADINVFDIEITPASIEESVKTIKAISPTFGGINLEDIKAPECFEIERRLIEELDIPVFHDDQHGTAIIASAAFLNALDIASKDLKTIKIVFSGAGAAAIATANLFLELGVPLSNITLCDTHGVIYSGRAENMNRYKLPFAKITKERTLSDALKNADVFIGCSVKDALTKEMVLSMNKNPIIFALANPDPEILPPLAHSYRSDIIMATGRSDYPNQVNNVLGFPSIFRAALDMRAKKINTAMKLAAVFALRDLAREKVPLSVCQAYNNQIFSYGREYLIPKPFDKRVVVEVATKVAEAAIQSGVAQVPQSFNLFEYKKRLTEKFS